MKGKEPVDAPQPTLDLASVRARLAASRGRAFWRSLEELSGSPEFEEMLHREFPRQASEWPEGLDRRRFLQLAAASLSLAGLTACTRQPLETIVPYVRQPETLVPGRPVFFATAMTLGGYAMGLLVESHEGRPTKIEGNPDHPSSLGATDAFAQAHVLGLYDPDRSQVLTELGTIQPWSSFVQVLSERLASQTAVEESGIRVLTETVTSPTLAAQLRALLARFPGSKWHQYDPAGRDRTRRAARFAFGEPLEARYDFNRADVVLGLDSDFLAIGPGRVRYARDFSRRRRARDGDGGMNRLYAIETAPTLAGALADHRLAVRPSVLPSLALALAADLGVAEARGAARIDDERLSRWISGAAADLAAHRGRAVVVPGDFAPAAVHVLAHAINRALDAVGSTVTYSDPVEASPVDPLDSLRELVNDMRAGRVELLVVLGGNPVFTAPADYGFIPAMLRVPLRIHLALEEDETSEYCHWHVPQAHELEAWGDARAHDGTTTVMQPLIEPLYGGKTAHELLSVLLDDPPRSAHDIVKEHWRQVHGLSGISGGNVLPPGRLPEKKSETPQSIGGEEAFETFWRKALHDGIVPGTALPARDAIVRPEAVANAVAALKRSAPVSGLAMTTASSSGAAVTTASSAGAAVTTTASPGTAAGPRAVVDGVELIFRPDPSLHDGRFANNGWLQELPRPLTTITWDNPALLGPATAKRLGLRNGDVIELTSAGRAVRAPAWIVPGHADGAVTLHFGHGRRRSGRVGSGTGVDVYPLRTSDSFWETRGVSVRGTGVRHDLAPTQEHFSMEGRNLVRAGTLEELRRNPEFAREMEEPPPPDLNLYPGFRYEGHAWGMAIDLNACTGCNACVVACQAENNIPVVGKDQVMRGREMHWIRIDRYYEGDPHDPSVHHQPVLCMHCEQAPCELVCPVAATTHSSEGLNDMVYNRCVGTRYCSNNCPYKVRRFNFLQYSDETTPVLKLLRNPNVSVRSRGVMEKCTYCVQRINAARTHAGKEDRSIRDGEVTTACQQACPSEAIVFGDINDPRSRVSRWKAAPTNYGLLEPLNTRPRTSYLAKVRNPNPKMEKV